MKIIVIRHAEAGGNTTGKIMSRSDDPLTQHGEEQARQLVFQLRHTNPDSIFCSPQRRAVQTIQPFAQSMNLEINRDDRLMELDVDDFIGKQDDSTVAAFGMGMRALLDAYSYDFHNFGGESYQDVYDRIKDFLDEIQSSLHSEVIIVTHDAIIRVIHLILKGKKCQGVPNASVHEFIV